MPSDRSHWPLVAAGSLAVAALIVGISHVAWPWMVDDAFISLRFAERLVAGQGLTWTDGERVEGYSNLLWVLLTACCLQLGIDGMTAVRGLGIACTAGTFAVLLGSRMLPGAWPAPLAVVALASLSATATWAIGGLEAPLMMLLVAIAMANVVAALKGSGQGPGQGEAVRTRRHLTAAGVALGLTACTRIDGPLWSIVAAAAVVACARGTPPNGAPLIQRLRWLLMIPLAAVLAQGAFRFAYYGDWLPNTGRAKAALSTASLASGAGYVAAAAVAMRSLLLPAVLGTARAIDRAARPAVLLSGLGVSAWWLYVLLVGGDAFPRSRLLVPSLVPLTVLAAHGFAVLAAINRAGRALAWIAAIGCVALATWDARRPTGDAPPQGLTRWEWFGKVTGEWLGRAFAREQPLVAVDAAGAVPYFSRLPSLDMLGLCDRTIAATPFPPDEAFVPGHRRANGEYVLSRQPDLVLFGLPPGSPQPQWLGGRQLERNERFLADYRIVLFHMGPTELPDGSRPDLMITAWARLEGRLGPRAEANGKRRLVLPAFWLGSYRQSYSFLSPPASVPRARVAHDLAAGAQVWLAAAVVGVLPAGRDAPVAEVRRPGRHTVPELRLAAGRYRVLANGLPAGVALALADASGRSLAAGDAWLVDGPAGELRAVDLVCDVPPAVALPFVIDHFVLERVD